MYRKSMREALEEARQYTAIHEVKVSKGRQTLDIAKDDLPVYKAKGWKLALESAASDRAKSLGLDYMSFGRYGKDGKVTHKNIDGTLTAVDKDEKPIKEPEDKKDDDSKIPADIKKGYDEIKDYEITDNNAEAVEKLEAAGQAFEDAGNEDYAGDIQDALEELMDDNVREADDLLSDLKIKIKRAAGMDVSNEELEEETINEMNAVNYARKLSSYAVKRGGIDKTSFMKIANSMASANNDTDIKRIGKQVDDMDTEPRDLVKGSIAIHMGPKTFEKMFGDRLTASDIKQYRRMTPSDLAEETITEFKRMSVFIPDPFKRAAAIRDISRFGGGTGFKIDVGSKTIKVDGKGKDLNKFAIDLKNFYGAQITAEAVELEETFTKKDFKDNERDNEHGLNAKKVVDMFGTGAEKMKIDAINARHNMRGSISREDQRTRDDIVNKYYSRLK